jgi:hypothetical protein
VNDENLHKRFTIFDKNWYSNFSRRGTVCVTVGGIVRCITGLIDRSSWCVLWWCMCWWGVAHRLFFGLTFAFISVILFQSKTKFTFQFANAFMITWGIIYLSFIHTYLKPDLHLQRERSKLYLNAWIKCVKRLIINDNLLIDWHHKKFKNKKTIVCLL